MDRKHQDRETRMEQTLEEAEALIDRLRSMSSDEVGEFLKLDVLSETLDRRVGQIGRYERGVFYDAFQVLVSEQFQLPTMEPCWRAN